MSGKIGSATMSGSSEAPLITIALVLYKRKAEESETYAALLEHLNEHPELRERFRLIIFDNSPKTHALPTSPVPITYIGDPSNPGLAGPYNKALDLAEDFGSPWLLLLDQDTQITASFLIELCAAITATPPVVAAIVPRLRGPRSIDSPATLPWLNRRPLDPSFTGIAKRTVMAFNSGACLRVKAMREIGGFPREFWLDYLDHAVFHLLQQEGGRVHVLRTVLRHDLSIADPNNKGSHERFANVLAAERLYYRKYGSAAQKLLNRLRLLQESLYLFLRAKDKSYAKMYLRAAVRFSDTSGH